MVVGGGGGGGGTGHVAGVEPVRRAQVAEVRVREVAREGFGQCARFGGEEGGGLRIAVEHEDAEGRGGGWGLGGH